MAKKKTNGPSARELLARAREREARGEVFMYGYDKILSEAWKPTNEMITWLHANMPRDNNINRWWLDDIETYHLGNGQWAISSMRYIDPCRIVFEDEKDFIWFDLTWG